MPIAKSQQAMCYIKGCIYMFGGRLQDGSATSVCEKYVIKEDRWVPLPAMKAPRSSMAVCRYRHDDIYVLFGAEGSKGQATVSKRIEVYNVYLDRWS